MARDRERLDVLLVERGIADSRTYAQRLIRAGTVLVDTQRVDKPGTMIARDAPLRCTVLERKYASRGGHKLAAALDAFAVDVTGWVAADLGASTGGFTDCLLQRGAAHVFAVDVGRGLLDARLANDDRVTVIDKTNARSIDADALGRRVALVTLDLSFISLTKVLPAAASLLQPEGTIIALIKPQFEAGREQVPRGGVVRDSGVHRAVLVAMRDAAPHAGLVLRNAIASPIAGAKGNREFLGLFTGEGHAVDDEALDAAIDARMVDGEVC